MANPVNDTDVANKQYVKMGVSCSDDSLKVGDTITRDLLVNFNGTDSTRTLGCNNITGGRLFRLLFGDLNNRLEHPFTQSMGLYTANGLSVFKNNSKIIGIADGVANETSFYSEILMNNRKISDLAEPVVNSDAVTKLYVDSRSLLPTTKYTFPSATDNTGEYA